VPRRPLHHTVERQVFNHYYFAHYSSSSQWICAI
jgi:hypothetical protein